MPIHEHRFEQGLTLLAEPLPGARTAAASLSVAAGASAEPEDACGMAAVLAEWCARGADGRDARALSDALDRFGADWTVDAGQTTAGVSMLCLGEDLPQTLPLLLGVAVRPTLEDAAFGPSRDLQLQAVAGLADEPQRRCFIELREAYLPEPLNRPADGRAEDLAGLTPEAARRWYRRQARPGGAVLAVAGAFDWDTLVASVGEAVHDWSGRSDWDAGRSAGHDLGARRLRGVRHVRQASSQTHIAVAYPGLPAEHGDLPLMASVLGVLSGGMSGRLFTEVREKRGLCYSVSASHRAGRFRGDVYAYAGTTTARAQETLDVLLGELDRVREGVTADELDRALVGMRSGLVMQGESTSARASSIAGDWWTLGRARTLDQRRRELDTVDLERVNAFLASRPAAEPAVVTLGELPLTVPGG